MSSRSKIKSLSALSKKLTGIKARVVFTNGCFDLLHSGHVSLLERAKIKGDVLVVALNTDASVSKIKGPSRPINSLQDRMQVVAALGCVDWVTWFDEPTPIKAILKIKPRILIKGGDWKPSQIVGAKEVKSWGGRVLSLKLRPGKSSTAIIRKSQS